MLIAYGMSVRNATRLSATFRYSKGSAQLDARGVRDIDFAALAAGQGLTLNVIGFTDEDGNINKNIKRAGQRASSVADTIRARRRARHHDRDRPRARRRAGRPRHMRCEREGEAEEPVGRDLADEALSEGGAPRVAAAAMERVLAEDGVRTGRCLRPAAAR